MAITKSVTVSLRVLAVPDFFPEVAPTALEVVKGVVAKYLCSITSNSTFTGSVRLSTPWPGATWSVTEIGVGDIAELSIATDVLDVAGYDIPIFFEEV
jgi:hypothetical protein